MEVQNEDISRGIYKAKLMKTMSTVVWVYAGFILVALVCFLGLRFFHLTVSFFFGGWMEPWVPNGWEAFVLVYVIAGLLFLLCYVIYYLREINCRVEFDENVLYITGYYRGEKTEQAVHTESIKYAYWAGNVFSYNNQKYRGVTLVTLDGKKIKNIPVEYGSDLYDFFRKIVKYDFYRSIRF